MTHDRHTARSDRGALPRRWRRDGRNDPCARLVADADWPDHLLVTKPPHDGTIPADQSFPPAALVGHTTLFTVAHSPVPDETVPSRIGAVLATVHECGPETAVIAVPASFDFRPLPLCFWTGSVKMAISTCETLPMERFKASRASLPWRATRSPGRGAWGRVGRDRVRRSRSGA